MPIKHKASLAWAALAALGLAVATPVAAQINTVAKFNSVNGSFPNSSVLFDSLGNLYGTTATGGTGGGFGTVFEVKKGSTAITTLASFTGTNGVGPVGSLTSDSLGNLYGITPSGGVTYSSGSSGLGYGAVFEAKKGSNNAYTITDLASFNGVNGGNPQAGLIFDSSGNLYGTSLGPSTVFEVAKGSSAITTLARFNGANGAQPFSSLTFDSLGNLYGTTYGGGTNNKGTIFEVAQGSNAITSLASFNNMNGIYPQAGLTLDSRGNLYGTAKGGGPGGGGTVFELDNPNPAVVLTPESSGLANTGGALLALALAGLVTAVRKTVKKKRAKALA